MIKGVAQKPTCLLTHAKPWFGLVSCVSGTMVWGRNLINKKPMSQFSLQVIAMKRLVNLNSVHLLHVYLDTEVQL